MRTVTDAPVQAWPRGSGVALGCTAARGSAGQGVHKKVYTMPFSAPTIRFTTAGLSALPATGKTHDLADAAVAGLILRVGPTGRKRWLFRFKWKGRSSRIKVGPSPSPGPARAGGAKNDGIQHLMSGFCGEHFALVCERSRERFRTHQRTGLDSLGTSS